MSATITSSRRQAETEQQFRLWIFRYEGRRLTKWDDSPSRATVVMPALDGHYSATQAKAFLEGFNCEMLGDQQRRWAVAVPVKIRYYGDLAPGHQECDLKGARLALSL